jgi:hypothetical protein
MTDPTTDALWKNALDRWDDDKAHAAFLEHCQRTDQLPEAAARYRGMAGDRERGPSAGKRLEAVALLAMAKLETMRGGRSVSRPRWPSYVLIALFVFGTIALLQLVLGHP